MCSNESYAMLHMKKKDGCGGGDREGGCLGRARRRGT